MGSHTQVERYNEKAAVWWGRRTEGEERWRQVILQVVERWY